MSIASTAGGTTGRLQRELRSWTPRPWPFHPERGDADHHEIPASAPRSALASSGYGGHHHVRRRDGLGVCLGSDHLLCGIQVLEQTPGSITPQWIALGRFAAEYLGAGVGQDLGAIGTGDLGRSIEHADAVQHGVFAPRWRIRPSTSRELANDSIVWRVIARSGGLRSAVSRSPGRSHRRGGRHG